MKVAERIQLVVTELKAGHFKAAKDALFGSHNGRKVRSESGGYHLGQRLKSSVAKLYRKLTNRRVKRVTVPDNIMIRQTASKLAAEAQEKHQALKKSHEPKSLPKPEKAVSAIKKKTQGYRERPSLIKRDLKRLDPRNPAVIEAYSLKIQKAVAELKANNPQLDQAAQDWMFTLFKDVSFSKRDLMLAAKLRQIDERGASNPHLNSLRMYLNMAIAIDVVKEGPKPRDHYDVAWMDKSSRLNEKKQAVALRARTSWMAQADSKTLRRLALQPAKLNQIIGAPYDMRQELQGLQKAVGELPESIAENRQLRKIVKTINAVMNDSDRKRDDFAVSAAVHTCKKALEKLAESSSADMAAVNFARAWESWPENYTQL